MPKVVTANMLASGTVVYLARGGAWVPRLADAVVADTADELAVLERVALAAVESCTVTAVYAFDVRVAGDRPEPLSVRERLRADLAVAA